MALDDAANTADAFKSIRLFLAFHGAAGWLGSENEKTFEWQVRKIIRSTAGAQTPWCVEGQGSTGAHQGRMDWYYLDR